MESTREKEEDLSLIERLVGRTPNENRVKDDRILTDVNPKSV